MAFDYTKKANYHYIDLSDIDESLLNHPLYPNRTGNEKNALYFADKAFLCEALCSRFNATKGLISKKTNSTDYDYILSQGQDITLSTAALENKGYYFDDYLVSSLPSSTVYASAEEAIKNEITSKYFPLSSISDLVTTSEDDPNLFTLYLAHTPYTSAGRWLDKEKISGGYNILQKIKDYKYCYYKYFLSQPAATYITTVEEAASNFSVSLGDESLLCYRKLTAVAGDWREKYNGCYYTERLSDYYYTKVRAGMEECVRLRPFILVSFNDLVRTASYYRFVELTSPDGIYQSDNLLSIGLELCPNYTSYSSWTHYQHFSITPTSSSDNGIYIFAESLVDIDY